MVVVKKWGLSEGILTLGYWTSWKWSFFFRREWVVPLDRCRGVSRTGWGLLAEPSELFRFRPSRLFRKVVGGVMKSWKPSLGWEA